LKFNQAEDTSTAAETSCSWGTRFINTGAGKSSRKWP